MPGQDYTISATAERMPSAHASDAPRWRDTWYMDTDAVVLEFEVDSSKEIGSIGLRPDSDIWSQFSFVEFCPALAEVYLHRRPMTPERLICAQSSQHVLRQACASHELCPLVEGEDTVFVRWAYGDEATVGDESIHIVLLDSEASPTNEGAYRLRDKPVVIGVNQNETLVAVSIDDINNDSAGAAIALTGYLLLFVFFAVNGSEQIPVSSARLTAAFGIFATMYVRIHLNICRKIKYFLIPYALDGLMTHSLIVLISTCIPITAALFLLIESHVCARATSVWRISMRGHLVTLSTLLPAFFVLLVGMDKINILLMATVGLLANTCVIRDIFAPVFSSPAGLFSFSAWAVTSLTGALVAGWVYMAVLFPLVSEVLLFAARPFSLVCFSIFCHIVAISSVTVEANKQ